MSPIAVASMNPNYRVWLFGKDELNNKISIMAAMPETLSISVTGNWQSVLPGGNIADLAANIPAIGKAISAASKTMQMTTGYTTMNQTLTMDVWASTSPIELRIPFQFNAISNPKTEIIQPLASLLKLCSPSTVDKTGGFLRAPGPTFLGNSPYNISLMLGPNITFTNVLVRNVMANMDSILDKTGTFLSAHVDVDISTNMIMTKADIDRIFGTTSSGADTSKFPSITMNDLNNAANTLVSDVRTAGQNVVANVKSFFGGG